MWPTRAAPLSRFFAREALRVRGELARARQRAEEVSGAFVHQAPGGAVRVDRHPTNGIAGECPVPGLSRAGRGEELDRFADVAKSPTATRLVEDAVQLGCERGSLPCQQDFAAARLGGHAGGKVDGCPEIVAVALDGGSVMKSDSYPRRPVLAHELVRDPQTQQDRRGG